MGLKQRVAALTATILSGAILVTGQFAPMAAADGIYGGRPVVGKIEAAYVSSGGALKWGNPTSNEAPAARGGRFQVFAKDTSFYWQPQVGGGTAHQVGGAIKARWGSLNWERGALGFPTSDEKAEGKARTNTFQGGTIYWSAKGGTHPVWGEIYKRWQAQKGAAGFYGAPISDEYRIDGAFAQDFSNGTIYWP